MYRPAVLVAFAFSTTFAVPSVAQESAGAQALRVDSLFSKYSRAASPGLAVAVVRNGQVVLRKGYGLANLEHRVPITPSTVFDVASVSKQFAGLAVAMLAEQGRINLRDDIRKYIPELQDFGHTITIDHLLHHTSGLRDWPGTLAVAGWRMDDVIAFDQILSMAFHQKTLNFVPGAEYTYSNTGYNMLAELVARVTGKTFAQWTEENLFRPLGMTSSHFHDDHTLVVPNRAYGYARVSDSVYRAVTNNLMALGSSSLYSTVDDLAKWVINFETARVGGSAAMALTRSRGALNDGSTIPYAFGVSHGEYRGLPTVSHSGGWASFSTFVLHFPRQRVGVVVLANTNAINATRAAYDVASIVLGGELTAATLASSSPPRSATVAPAVLDQYAGVYRLGPGWYLRIRRDGATLKTQATREDEVPMSARSQTEFWVEAYDAPITFQRDASGKVTHVMYRGRRAPRVEGTSPPPSIPVAQLVGDYTSDELQTTYRVERSDGALVMRHYRHGTITLVPAWGDDYSGSMWFMRSVQFERDGAGKVTGLLVNVDERSRDIRFRKH
jgi:CubicO group peptidase (beta-lactamase class C family)